MLASSPLAVHRHDSLAYILIDKFDESGSGQSVPDIFHLGRSKESHADADDYY